MKSVVALSKLTVVTNRLDDTDGIALLKSQFKSGEKVHSSASIKMTHLMVLFHHSKMCFDYSFIKGWVFAPVLPTNLWIGGVAPNSPCLVLVFHLSFPHNGTTQHDTWTRGFDMHRFADGMPFANNLTKTKSISDKRKLPSLPKWTKKSSLPRCFSQLMLNKDWASRRWMDCGSSSCSGWNWGSW